MKTKRIIKRFTALCLCLSLTIINFNSSMVKAETVNTDLSSMTATIFNNEVSDNPEIAIIDKIANEYYNYFVENGVTSEDVKEMVKSTGNEDLNKSTSLFSGKINNLISEPSISVLSAGTLDYSALVQQVTGYNYTFNQIGAQLASIGILMNLASAIPFLDLLALLAGGIIVTLVIAVAYSVIAVRVNDLILTWYAYSGVNLTASRLNTVAIVSQYDNGARYWKAYLSNYAGLGGITVTIPITYHDAGIIVKKNNSFDNVFAMHYSDAALLATSAYGNGFIGPEAHRPNGQVLNMQHVHAKLVSGAHGLCHIFFAIPVVA